MATEQAAAAAIQELNTIVSTLGKVSVEQSRAEAAAVGFGWWIRILSTAQGIRLMHEAELPHEASPLLRTIMHHTAALEWLRHESETVITALTYDHRRRRQSLAQKASDRNWDLKGVRFGPPPSGEKPDEIQLLTNFDKLCDHVGVPNLYIGHLIESAYVHPSALSADAYLDVDDSDNLQLHDSPTVAVAPLTTTVMFCATATNILGAFLDDWRLVAVAHDVGQRLSVPISFSDAANM